MLTRNRSDKRIESILEFRCDEILSVFGTVDCVYVIVGIGMAHALQGFAGRITGLVPRLRRSAIVAMDVPALPGWADVWRAGPFGKLRAGSPGLGFEQAPERSASIESPSIALQSSRSDNSVWDGRGASVEGGFPSCYARFQ